jgi:hypothetical protein
MIVKTACIATCLLIAAPAQAGGLFGDLNRANKNLGSSITNPVVGGATTSPSASNSKTCVTPQGSCDIASPTLNGTTCYCDIDKNQVFGRIQ